MNQKSSGMTDTDLIRRCVERAPNWEWVRDDTFHVSSPNSEWFEDTWEFRAVLAAEMVRMVQHDPHTVLKMSVVDSATFVELIIYNPNGDEEAEPLRFVGHEENDAIAKLRACDEFFTETDNG